MVLLVLIGDKTDMYAQGYFSYDSKKSGGVTVSHLRFGKNPIKSTYLIDEADYIACHNPSYVTQYDLVDGLKKGGKFVLNCKWNAEELDAHLPAAMKQYIAKNEIEFYTLDGTTIAEEIGLGNRINMVMQSAFFKLANVIPYEDAAQYLKEAIEKSYGRKGQNIVDMNNKAVDMGAERLVKIEIPASWATAVDADVAADETGTDFIKKILRPVNAQKGHKLPVSTFEGIEDGSFEAGTAAYEKRGIAVNVPEWHIDNCIQCNQCSFVCPHAAIRPVLLTEEEVANAPEGFATKPAMGKGLEGLQYKIQVSPLDCTGCGNCADICPSKVPSLEMKALDTQEAEVANWEFAMSVPVKDDKMSLGTVKGSQFAQPLFEFSGACAGCGETPYIKAVTQLYGDRMMIANATGCSSIWGGSAPSTPYTVNAKGQGPAWANSLFEDNAEYGYGMNLGVKAIRSGMKSKFEELVAMDVDAAVKAPFEAWLEGMEDADKSKAAAAAIRKVVETETASADAQAILDFAKENDDFLVKKSVWIVGGDGWAYDIGYGGLDHVLASNENVNVLVFDTEVYSNTGGQASKSTPTAAVAQFAAAGKRVKKKDLGMIATTYGYVYVAQVAMGANKNQFMKALQEAESYDGPSLIIAYAPCIAHGIKAGMGKTQERTQLAVEAGYWHMWRFDPRLKEAGQNPFVLDSKEPTASFRDFLMGEVRYTTLASQFPEMSDELFATAEAEAKDRYEGYVRMTKMEY